MHYIISWFMFIGLPRIWQMYYVMVARVVNSARFLASPPQMLAKQSIVVEAASVR